MTGSRHDVLPGRPRAAGSRRSVVGAAVRIAGPPAVLAVVATIALVAVLATLEGSRSLALNGWLLAVGGLVVWGLWRALAAALPRSAASAFDSVRAHPMEPPSKLHGVIDIESAILDAEWSRGGLEFRLRPLLRRVAAARLLELHQVDLDTEPAAAHRILGDELWALVGPAAGAPGPAEPAPSDLEAAETALSGADGSNPDSPAPSPPEWTRRRRGRHGIPRAAIRRAVDLLEAL